MPALEFAEGAEPWAHQSYRKQLLNHIVDGKARTRPQAVWAKIPQDPTSYKGGYRKITYRMLANAINGVAAWIVNEFALSKNFETLAYVGPWDPRYVIVILGAVKAGYKVVTPSPTYPIGGLVPLLAHLQTKAVLVGSSQMPLCSQLRDVQSNIPIKEIPALNVLLDTVYPHFPYTKTFKEAENDPLVVAHTSGSTGIPKPLVLSHGWAACWIEHNQLAPPPGHRSIERLLHGVEMCAVTPPFHCSNYFPYFWGALPNDIVCVYPLPTATLTLDTAVNMVRYNDPDVLVAPPHILQGLASSEELLKEFETKISSIGYGGGPLPEVAGKILSARFKLMSLWGSSEMGLTCKIAQLQDGQDAYEAWDPDDWRGFKPHPRDGIEFRLLPGADDFYEAFVVRNKIPEEEQAVFKLYPKLSEWSPKDIFSPDPDPKRNGHWIYQGRVDDIITLSTGGKLNPLGYEHTLMKEPYVKAALLVGSGRERTALLVEPDESFLNGVNGNERVNGVPNTLWTAVEKCNSIFPPQATVSKGSIIVVDKMKPLPRAGKGTIQRELAVKLYGKEIDALYD